MKIILSALCALVAISALAEEAYYRVPVSAFALQEGKLPADYEWKGNWTMIGSLKPYAALDGEGEIFVSEESFRPWEPGPPAYERMMVDIRATKGAALAGRLFVPKADLSGMVALKFRLEAASAKSGSKEEFLRAKESHYRSLREEHIPGGAWFRHQETEAAKARGGQAAPETTQPRFGRHWQPAWEEGYDATYDLFSGGRALSENLQLERLLQAAGTNASTVALSNLSGITVREMDWKALLQEAKPALDPLAANIPFDQHALFFTSFEAMTQWLDEVDRNGTPVLQMFEPRSEDANSRGHYQRQLCLELNELSRLIGPKLITSIAFTGSDPYLRTGTDIAVLYETASAGTLQTLVQARQTAAQLANPSVKTVKGEIEGVGFTGVVSDDRVISSYVAALKDVVLVSNSRAQLERLLGVARGKTPALATQDDYRFFRQKYSRSEPGETGFLVLSDATIRRWCGPQWRIANSRRIRAAAALAELQAANLDTLASGQVKPGCIATNLPEVGSVLLTTNGVRSVSYGTLEFLTPIIEMPLAVVTQSEADGYNRWRTGYQQNWSQVFDPIAVRFSISAERLAAEVSVIPLIAGSEYRRFIGVSTGAHIAPRAGDPHPEALLHLALAINSQSETIKESGNFLGNFSPNLRVNPLGWLGECMAIYADGDPFWDDLVKAPRSSEFLETNYFRLPVAVYFEVKNPLGVTAFLASVRAFAEQSAPQMTVWENLEYNGQAYVKVATHERGSGENGMTNLCIYYAVTPKSLVLTLSEAVLKRGLDRQRARLDGTKAGASDAQAVNPWVGTNLCLKVEQSFVPALEALLREGYRPQQQRLAWSNLPILNEWKRRYPRLDPLKVHEQFWNTILVCPGGGRYVWNDEWQTMESTVYGHPGQPKAGPDNLLPVANILRANLGLTFENQGLSAKAVLERGEAGRSK